MSENFSVAAELKEIMLKQQGRIFGLRQTETKLQNQILKLKQINEELTVKLDGEKCASKYFKKTINELRVENQNLDIKNEKLESENEQLKKDLKQHTKHNS